MSKETSTACGELQARADKLCEGDFTTEHFASLAGIGESAFEIFRDVLRDDLPYQGSRALRRLELYKRNVKAFLVKVLENENESWECPLHSVHAHFYRNILNKVKEPPLRQKMVKKWLQLWNDVVNEMIAVAADGEKENLSLLQSKLETSFKIMVVEEEDGRCESLDASPDACGCVIS
jgi:hypothetical protein